MLFPTLKNKKSAQVNLDLEAQSWLAKKGLSNLENNPLLNPVRCQEMLNDIHEKYEIDFSYGGYLEDRSFLWKNSYLDMLQNYIHLGVDFNVPSNTKVAMPFDAKVVKIDDDYPDESGWGPRVIVKNQAEPVYLLFAHLDRALKCKVGDLLKAKEIFAKVGKAPYNGNWFSHLHLQTITEKYYNELIQNGSWGELDGYGTRADTEKNAKNFPDPTKFL